ncbi:MAG: PAS domain-containing protein [Sediminibacterium sp.]|nr:PAS domain-containing protein [Sediminibacterium sp.]
MLKLLQSISEANAILLEENEIDTALNNVVAVLGAATEVDRCYIFTNRIVEGEIRLFYTHEWCKEGVEPQLGFPDISNVSYDIIPDLYETLSQDKFMYGLVRASENQFFKEAMEAQSILTYLFAPIFCKNIFWGWIGFDNCTTEEVWEIEEVNALYAVARNIGLRLARNAAEQARMKEMERFDLSVKGSQQGLWEWDIQNNKLDYSAIFMNMIGYEHFEFEHTYENWRNRLHPEDLNRVEETLHQYLNKSIPKFNVEFRLLHKKGYYKWIKGSGVAKWNEQNQAVYMVGSHLDIHELKQQQEYLELQKDNFDRLLNSLGEAVFRLDQENRITFMNNFWKDITGFEPGEAILKPIDYCFVAEDSARIQELIHSLKNTQGLSNSAEVRLLNKKGEWRWVELTMREHRTTTETDYFIAGSIIDIHDKKLAADKEKELAELKAGFVSLTSHQFRTPLTVIFSNMEVIELSAAKQNTTLSDTIRNSAKMIKEQIDRMTHLMDNILLVGRYDAKQLLYNLRPQNLSDLIHSVVNTYYLNQPDGRKLVVFEEISNRKVALDEMLFMHVLTNIISNAFKYSSGSQNPELYLIQKEAAAEIIIKDYGIGIPEDELDKVFKSFYRASNTITYQGSGLGLSVARQFMELMKGSIHLESKLGEGTTVTLRLPYIEEEPSTQIK